MKIIPTKIRKLWSAEEIRILVLLSLGLQIVLIFVSLFRKRCQNRLLSFILWTSYLGADYVANLALGNLLNDQTEASEQNINGDLTAFWAPFLLLHLGGPDTITSYSREDNELWLRHLSVAGARGLRGHPGVPRVAAEPPLVESRHRGVHRRNPQVCGAGAGALVGQYRPAEEIHDHQPA
ncbi:hypothetical protein MUK42_35373 [Musa troglodytarum]|uniref:DUF4220 domain-containing protein n=1 Tax=Musa troglodytarum TaxID=320322 RepID=A0A9E7GXF0_9LILI|nr:hypothetical protein MUK42_35373 [Musa troglodytarum]